MKPSLLKPAAVLLALVALALSLPPLRPLIEQSMVWHMLVQMPLLALAGACAGLAWAPAKSAAGVLPGGVSRWNRYGLSGYMLAQCLLAYWMIPALVDRAVVLPAADATKIISLWIAGLALQQAHTRAPLGVQLFFLGYGLPMMAWLGLYLASTDLRLCNAYSLQSQINAGRGMLALAVGLGLVWAAAVVRRSRRAGLGSPA